MAKKRGFYAKTPVVPKKRIAGTNPIPGPSLGASDPGIMIDANPGVINSWGEQAHGFSHAHTTHPHGFGHSIRNRQGSVRLSGHGGAHQLGTKRSLKTPK